MQVGLFGPSNFSIFLWKSKGTLHFCLLFYVAGSPSKGSLFIAVCHRIVSAWPKEKSCNTQEKCKGQVVSYLIALYYILTGVREGQPGSALNPDFITQLLISVVYWYQDSLRRSNKWHDWRRKTQVQGLLFSDTHHPKSPWECLVESWSSYSYKTFSHPQVPELFTRKMNCWLAFQFPTCKSVNMSRTNAWRTKAKKVGGGTENPSENSESLWGEPKV